MDIPGRFPKGQRQASNELWDALQQIENDTIRKFMLMENASEAIKFTSVWCILSRTRAKVAPLQMGKWAEEKGEVRVWGGGELKLK